MLTIAAGASAGESSNNEGTSAELRAIIHSASVQHRLSYWGLSASDVQHDVDAMSPRQRGRLLRSLTRPWPRDAGYRVPDYQAQYLATVSLMRTSTLFASIVSSRPASFQ